MDVPTQTVSSPWAMIFRRARITSACFIISSACSSRYSPAAVGLAPFRVRVRSVMPYSRSSASICCMIALGVTYSRAAALVKLPERHTWTNTFNECFSMDAASIYIK